jgi:hypothetical protein
VVARARVLVSVVVRVRVRPLRPAARPATCSTLSPSHLPPPLRAGQGPQEAYSNSRNEWMVVDSNMVTTTGLECDKIGVDYRWAVCLCHRVCCRP